jgi:hypothetical protein
VTNTQAKTILKERKRERERERERGRERERSDFVTSCNKDNEGEGKEIKRRVKRGLSGMTNGKNLSLEPIL